MAASSTAAAILCPPAPSPFSGDLTLTWHSATQSASCGALNVCRVKYEAVRVKQQRGERYSLRWRTEKVGIVNGPRILTRTSAAAAAAAAADSAGNTGRGRGESEGEGFWWSVSISETSREAAEQEGSEEGEMDDAERRLYDTKKLVESCMLAAAGGLAFFLSNSLRLESYLGFFFPLPTVISCMRWGCAAGLQTMLTTIVLLFVLTGPIKALSFTLLYGVVGVAVGFSWKLGLPWTASVAASALVRMIGSFGFLFLSSWLIRDNILQLILLSAQTSLSHILAALGTQIVPSTKAVFLLFLSLVLVNCMSFVLLLHIVYTIFLRRLGFELPNRLPKWMERAL